MSKYRITCPNGSTHDFATMSEAMDWTEWGHLCLAYHLHDLTVVEEVSA